MIMKKRILFLIFPFLLASCFTEENWDAGTEMTRRINLQSFQTIDINSVFDFFLVQDTVNFALVTCGSNLMDNVMIQQKGNGLQCSQNIGMNWARTYKRTVIELHYKTLTSIQINKSSFIGTKNTFKGTEFSIKDNSPVSEIDIDIDCTGFRLSVERDNFGIYVVNGKTVSCGLELDGSAHFKTGNLLSDSCYVYHKGIGDCFVNTTRVLTGTILRTGSLMYYYHPSLKMQVENKNGKIVRIN